MSTILSFVVRMLTRAAVAALITLAAVLFTILFAATIEFLAHASYGVYAGIAAIALLAAGDKHWHTHRRS